MTAVFPEAEYQQAMKDQGKLPEEEVIESADDCLSGEISTEVVQVPLPHIIVNSLQTEANLLLTFAERRVIVTKEHVADATNDLTLIAKATKRLEDKRKEYVRPLQDEVKFINETFRQVSEPLGEADKITRDKILAWRQVQERLRQEQEEINQLRMDAAKKEMELKGELSEAVDLIEVSPEAPKHLYSELGTTSVVKSPPKWEVLDFALVPDEYKMPDATRIGKVVRAGIPSIPGIRIWQAETIRVSPTKRD